MEPTPVTVTTLLGLVDALLTTDRDVKYAGDRDEKFDLLKILGDVFEQEGLPRPPLYRLYWEYYDRDETSTDDDPVSRGEFISASERRAFMDGLYIGISMSGERLVFGFALKEGANPDMPLYKDVIWEDH